MRADRATTWTFEVLDVVPDSPMWGDAGVIIGNYTSSENARSEQSRGFVGGFLVAVKDPKRTAAIARLIDHHYANSSTPTQSIPARAAAQAMARTAVSVASMTWGVGAAGLFMIVFLTANHIHQSVRRRLPEFATLKAMGYADAGVMGAGVRGGRRTVLRWGCPRHRIGNGVCERPATVDPAGADQRAARHRVARHLGDSLRKRAVDRAVGFGAAGVGVAAPGCRGCDRRSAAMSFLPQLLTACRVGILSLKQRFGSSLVIVVGMACVAGTSLAMLSLSAGISRTLVSGGEPANAIVLPVDASFDYGIGLDRDAVGTILNAPGIARGSDGKPWRAQS